MNLEILLNTNLKHLLMQFIQKNKTIKYQTVSDCVFEMHYTEVLLTNINTTCMYVAIWLNQYTLLFCLNTKFCIQKVYKKVGS